MFLALVLVWNVGTITTDEALSGFNNPGVLAVGSLFVVIKGVERSRLAGMHRRSVTLQYIYRLFSIVEGVSTRVREHVGRESTRCESADGHDSNRVTQKMSCTVEERGLIPRDCGLVPEYEARKKGEHQTGRNAGQDMISRRVYRWTERKRNCTRGSPPGLPP